MICRRFVLAGFLLASACAAEEFSKPELTDILADPAAYQGKKIIACGWASNGFEDSNLTVSDARSPDRMDKTGLGIEWCKGADKLAKPTYGCVWGTIFPAPPVGEDAGNGMTKITIDNSSPYRWRIRQACKL